MGLYKNIDVDFVERTIEDLDYIEKNNVNLPQEITHLLNYCYGLFVLPEQKIDDIIALMPQELSYYGIRKEDITSHRKKTFKNFIRSMRNGFAHAQLKSLAMKSSTDFSALSIEDYDIDNKGHKKKTPHTSIELSLDQLKSFIFKFSHEYIKCKKQIS